MLNIVRLQWETTLKFNVLWMEPWLCLVFGKILVECWIRCLANFLSPRTGTLSLLSTIYKTWKEAFKHSAFEDVWRQQKVKFFIKYLLLFLSSTVVLTWNNLKLPLFYCLLNILRSIQPFIEFIKLSSLGRFFEAFTKRNNSFSRSRVAWNNNENCGENPSSQIISEHLKSTTTFWFPVSGKCKQLFRSFHVSQIICSLIFLERIHSKVFNADGFVFNEVVQIDTFNHYRLEFRALTSIKRWILESKPCNSIKPTNLAVAGEKLFVNILSLCVFFISRFHIIFPST